MDDNLIIQVLGFILFAISEILAIIPLPQNGIIQGILLTVRKCVTNIKQNDKDLDEQLKKLNDIPEFKKFITFLSNYPETKTFIENFLKVNNA